MGRDLKNNPVVLTEEQQKLISDNIGLVYKFCANKHITDEDLIQNFIVRLCIAVPTFDPEKGEFSTFVFTVLNTEFIHQYSISKKGEMPEEFEEVRLEWNQYRDSDEDTLVGSIGFEDPAFLKVEKVDAFKRALKIYKYKYPFTWKRDMKVCYSMANNSIPIADYKQVFGISRQRADQIMTRVSRFFIDCSNGKIKPPIIDESIDDNLFLTEGETFKVSEDNFMIVMGWIKNRTEMVKRSTKYLASSVDLATIAAEELDIDVSNSDMKKAMYLSGFYPVSRDFITSPVWDFAIAKDSIVYSKLKKLRKKVK